MIEPTGSASLAKRERYLRRRRGQAGLALTATWVGVAAVLCWLFIAGVAGLSH